MAEDVLFDGEKDQEPEAEEETGSKQAGPDRKLQSGSVHLDIWHNEDSADTYSFKRFYTQDDGETFQETQNMRPQDLQHVQNLINYVQMSEVDDTK